MSLASFFLYFAMQKMVWVSFSKYLNLSFHFFFLFFFCYSSCLFSHCLAKIQSSFLPLFFQILSFLFLFTAFLTVLSHHQSCLHHLLFFEKTQDSSIALSKLIWRRFQHWQILHLHLLRAYELTCLWNYESQRPRMQSWH